MANYREVYASQAVAYEALVSREDHQGNLRPLLESLGQPAGKGIVEFGAGTGRVTRLVAPSAAWVRAYDAYPAMVEEGRTRVAAAGLNHVTFAVADNKRLPEPDAVADLAVAGWTFGHCCAWFPDTWREEIGAAVREMLRVTRAGGTAIILETLGTGRREPLPPTPALAEYYRLLEDTFGFVRTWIRTDYRFESSAVADQLTTAFFGKTYALEPADGTAVTLPECTGVWHRRVPPPLE